MTKRLRMFLSLLAAMLVGLVVGLYAQSNSAARLAKLSEEKAEITKMDLVLLNTRVGVLQQMLKDDLGLTFTPTSFRYDSDKRKIRIAVHVGSAWLAKANINQLSKTLETRATALCRVPCRIWEIGAVEPDSRIVRPRSSGSTSREKSRTVSESSDLYDRPGDALSSKLGWLICVAVLCVGR